MANNRMSSRMTKPIIAPGLRLNLCQISPGGGIPPECRSRSLTTGSPPLHSSSSPPEIVIPSRRFCVGEGPTRGKMVRRDGESLTLDPGRMMTLRAVDLITKKRDGRELSRAEIQFLVEGHTEGTIPDYQVAAFAMAVYFQGMTREEILHLTTAMAESGELLHFSRILPGAVDKHSTGGVGDKATLVVVPLVAAAGVPVVKMSGRGLGHTGGTIDKMESIPGFRAELAPGDIVEAVRKVGAALVAQMDDLVPADGRLYALRDVTGTVDSLPLIATSIMSKKLAVGADALVLDVKAGAGALLAGEDEALELASLMVDIGTRAGRRVVAVVSDMNQPLGRSVGNSLEVAEAVSVLGGGGPSDVRELSLVLGSHMLVLGGTDPDLETAADRLKTLMASGTALDKMAQLVENQGGDSRIVHDPSLLPAAHCRLEVASGRGGYVTCLDARSIGKAAVSLGAGRDTGGSSIDHGAGVVLHKKIGDGVREGETLAVLHFNPDLQDRIRSAERLVKEAFTVGEEAVQPPALVHRVITPSRDPNSL